MAYLDHAETEHIARIAWEATRQVQIIASQEVNHTWETASDVDRASALNGVQHRIAFPDAPVSAQHDNWLQFRRSEGWTRGPVKDAKLKQHPALVPWSELPRYDRIKNHIFTSIVRAFIDER